MVETTIVKLAASNQSVDRIKDMNKSQLIAFASPREDIYAKSFGFDLNGAVMASDAFFPFPDCVEIAGNEGVDAVIQPGGSVKDQLSIDYCNEHNLAMVFTGVRHFKH